MLSPPPHPPSPLESPLLLLPPPLFELFMPLFLTRGKPKVFIPRPEWGKGREDLKGGEKGSLAPRKFVLILIYLPKFHEDDCFALSFPSCTVVYGTGRNEMRSRGNSH